MKPKKIGRTTRCGACDGKITDLKAIDCQLCVQWICLHCAEMPGNLFDFLQADEEAKDSMSFLCKDCKLEIPTLREMKGIQEKQAEMEKDIVNIRKAAVETNNTAKEIKETLALQGTEIVRHETELRDLYKRLEDVETAAVITPEGNEDNYATRTARGVTSIQQIVRTQVNEQAEIEKIRKNLVISGIAESENDEEDTTKVLDLIEKELNITADINKVERLGKPRVQGDGEDPPSPRLLKLFFVTQRSRKEVLAKATKLRTSTDEHVKKLVYIRPDLTRKQLEESKNLRELLRKTKTDNPNKTYKIYRNQIIEVASTAGNHPVTPTAAETHQPNDDGQTS